jgi:hypothetical protein
VNCIARYKTFSYYWKKIYGYLPATGNTIILKGAKKKNIYIYIQGVPGGMCQTSGESSLC